MREIPTEEQIHGMMREEVYKAVEDAGMELFRSGRGTSVRRELTKLLDGPISQLDENHWVSILTLIQFYRCGWTGAVLEELKYGKAVKK